MSCFTARTDCGFTLIELMITLLVAGILAAIVAPSFQSLIQSTTLATNTNSVVASLSTARSEAIKQGVPVKVETTDNSTNWSNGWQVVKLHADGSACDASEDCLIKTFSALKTNYSLSLVDKSDTKKSELTYTPIGMLKNTTITPMTYRVCATGYNHYKSVQIEETGRPVTTDVSGSCP